MAAEFKCMGYSIPLPNPSSPSKCVTIRVGTTFKEGCRLLRILTVIPLSAGGCADVYGPGWAFVAGAIVSNLDIGCHFSSGCPSGCSCEDEVVREAGLFHRFLVIPVPIPLATWPTCIAVLLVGCEFGVQLRIGTCKPPGAAPKPEPGPPGKKHGLPGF